MKKETKKILVAAIPVIIFIMIFAVIPSIVYLIGRTNFSLIKNYESYWGIQLPDHMELVSDSKSPTSFHGDGIRHTIFSVCEEQQIPMSFAVGTSSDIEIFCNEISSELGVEKADFSLKYMWHKYEKYENTLVIVYFPETRQLHLFQRTI